MTKEQIIRTCEIILPPTERLSDEQRREHRDVMELRAAQGEKLAAEWLAANPKASADAQP